MWRSVGLVIISTVLATTVLSLEMVKQNGDDLTLSCAVTRSTIQWKVNGEDTDQTGSKGTGATFNSTLQLHNLNASDAGTYECFGGSTGTLIRNFTVSIISISGTDMDVIGNITVAKLGCSVDNEDLKVSSLLWKWNNTVLNNTERYTVTEKNKTSTYLTISEPGSKDAGLYQCVVSIEGMSRVFVHSVALNTPAHVGKIAKLRNKVEGETAVIECNVTGFPVPRIKWYRQLDGSEEMVEIKHENDARVNATTSKSGVPQAKLVIGDLTISNDLGEYTCVASNDLGSSNSSALLKVKDKLAAVWPFLGICAEVAVLCIIIFIFEKRRNRKMEEEEEVDAVKQDLMNQSNGTEDKEVRQRSVATKA